MEFLSEHKNPLTQSRINHGPQKFQTSKLQIRTCFRCMFDTMTEQDMIRGHRKKSVMLTDSELLEVRGKYFEDGRFTHHHKRLISPTVITK